MSRDDRSREVLAVATLFFVLTWVTVGLRAYVRARLMKTWGTDDWYMVGAQVCRPLALFHSDVNRVT